MASHKRALVVGTNKEQTNIGSAILRRLAEEVHVDGRAYYGAGDLPSVNDVFKSRYTDLVVTCGWMRIVPFDHLDLSSIDRIIAANLTIPLQVVNNFIKGTIARGEHPDTHSIVLIGSYAHDHVLSHSTPYCAAKAGLDMAVKCLAWEYTGRGYNLFGVHPHSVKDTPMTASVVEQIARDKNLTADDAQKYWERNKLLDERLTMDEIAAVVRMLILDCPTRHMSGACIDLYGGER